VVPAISGAPQRDACGSEGPGPNVWPVAFDSGHDGDLNGYYRCGMDFDPNSIFLFRPGSLVAGGKWQECQAAGPVLPVRLYSGWHAGGAVMRAVVVMPSTKPFSAAPASAGFYEADQRAARHQARTQSR